MPLNWWDVIPKQDLELRICSLSSSSDIIRRLIDKGVVLPTVRTSKPKIWTKPKNVAPSSPPKNKPDKHRKWFNGLTKAPSGTFESVKIEELEKHYITWVQSFPVDEEGYQDVLISRDKILSKSLKICCFLNTLSTICCWNTLFLYWNSCTLQEQNDCYNELRSWLM